MRDVNKSHSGRGNVAGVMKRQKLERREESEGLNGGIVCDM